MKTTNIYVKHIRLIAFVAFTLSLVTSTSNSANVVSRTQRKSVVSTASSIPAQRDQNASNATSQQIESVTEIEPTVIEDTEYQESEIIENKTSQFDDVLDETFENTISGEPETELARQIREQRAAADAAEQKNTTTNRAKVAMAAGKNECDQKLRTCMQGKCGTDFTKCSGDTDTTFGNKLDACRRDITCTGEEYRLFTNEIKADMELNAKFALYNSIVDCGNNYNSCIVAECGQTFTKCLSKKNGDAAVQKCSKIANECKQQDSGLPARMMEVFGTLRLDAESQVSNDEKRLYQLRDQMRESCGRLGAMFDERTLDCVYTVNFYAGENNTLYSSKKAYAGSTFDCTPNWFGVDITTFMENAQRLTRAQTSATNALMGSGVGMAVGAVTSGAIDRAVDRHKANKALDKAQDEHDETFEEDGDDGNQSLKEDKKEKKTKKNNKNQTNNTTPSEGGSTSTAKDKKKLIKPAAERAADAENQTQCATIAGYRWNGDKCVKRTEDEDRAAKCALTPGKKYDKKTGKCI